MAIGTITKVLAAMQDLALGVGQETQTRNNQLVLVDKMAIPFGFPSVEAIRALDYTKIPVAKLIGPEFVDYYYDSSSEADADNNNVLMPDSGIGRWLKIAITAAFGVGGNCILVSNFNTITFGGFFTNGDNTAAIGIPEPSTDIGMIHLKLEGAVNTVGKYIQVAFTKNNRIYSRYVSNEENNGWRLESNARSKDITEADYVFTIDDIGEYLRFTNPGVATLSGGMQIVSQGQEIHGRNAGATDLTLVGSGADINEPTEGTLVIPPGGTFTLKHAGGTEYDLFGITNLAEEGGGGMA